MSLRVSCPIVAFEVSDSLISVIRTDLAGMWRFRSSLTAYRRRATTLKSTRANTMRAMKSYGEGWMQLRARLAGVMSQ